MSSPAVAPVENLRPRDVYPDLTREEVVEWLQTAYAGRYRIAGFRMVKYYERYLTTTEEDHTSVVARGKQMANWGALIYTPAGPRIILEKVKGED